MELVTETKIPNRLSRIRTQSIKTEVRPTIDHDSYEIEDEMMSMEELEAALATIARKVRDISTC